MSTKFVSYVEDAEEDSGSSIGGVPGTRRYAVSEAPVGRERPNTDSTPRSSRRNREAQEARREYEREREREMRDKDRRRKERKQKEAAEMVQRKVRADAKAVREREREREQQQREREQQQREREAKPARKARPTSLTQSRTEPVVQQYRRGHVEDPSCYGVKQPAASGMRPRAQTRPNSYYPGGPPSAMGPPGWHQAPPSQQPPAGYPVGSFPPPPIYGGGGPSPSMIGVPSSPAHHAPSFFDMSMQQGNAHLKNRFERPASAMGYRQQAKGPSPAAYGINPGDYEEEPPEPRMPRRTSRSKKQPPALEDDRRRMPPPEYIPRPQSAALPAATPFRPPPMPTGRAEKPTRNKSRPPTSRRNISFAEHQEFDDEDFDGDELYADEPTYNRHTALARTRRGSVAYEQQGLDIIPAGSRTRRDSFFDSRALGSGGVSLDDEEKYMTALAYQDDISGGPGLPLTAEALRKASTRAAGGGSSRSTRSSDSRDESEYRQSNTTGITRSSSSDNDNVTIKVSGSAVVRVQGAEIECGDGGEITFSAPTSSRVGSDRASTVYQLEDNRSRVERKALPHRIRAPSQVDSHRAYPAIAYAPYDPSFAAEDYT